MKKTVEVELVRETGGTVIYGEPTDDPGRLKSVYLPKSWFKGAPPKSGEFTFSSKSKKGEED